MVQMNIQVPLSAVMVLTLSVYGNAEYMKPVKYALIASTSKPFRYVQDVRPQVLSVVCARAAGCPLSGRTTFVRVEVDLP